ncbi:MAG: glycoside hydrolase family 16 protein [Puniceicoccales bacterium]
MSVRKNWKRVARLLSGGILLVSSAELIASEKDWLPEGKWELEWADEFSGSGSIDEWYPMLGYTPEEYQGKESKGLRWNGPTEGSAQMYSSKKGNHWLNGEGQLVIRVVADKTETNDNGIVVNAAYLQTGYPAAWDSTEPTGVRWEGMFVSPEDAPLYLVARVRTDPVVGHSTWFAFWLFSQTRSYNDFPEDGTEVDVIEIAKGEPDYMDQSFNVANHWSQSGGSESLQMSAGTDPSSLSFVDVTDTDYHTYGIEWTQEVMRCYVDGELYYTFTENVPSRPVDMMMLLTMEFQVNAWDPNQGDGRVSGPYVSDDESVREMSRALVDYVRVYRRQ